MATTTTSTDRSVPAAHTLVITLNADELAPGHTWDCGCENCDTLPFTLALECPGVEAGQCFLWSPCQQCADRLERLSPKAREGYLRMDTHHGQPHRTYGGAPCTQTTHCYVQTAFDENGCEDAWSIATSKGPGRHQVSWDGGELSDLILLYAGPASA